MTLLVLELKVPDLPRSASPADIGNALRADAPVFFSFLITFMFASLFWYLHHAVLNFIQELRPRLVVLNLAFLGFMSLVPFWVGMLGHFLRNPLAQTLYFGNQFVLSLLLLLLWHSARSLNLIVDPHGRDAARLALRLTGIPIGSAAAAACAWIRPEFSFYAFAVVTVVLRMYARKRAAPAQ
jgi:uncharacterized membrane protein